MTLNRFLHTWNWLFAVAAVIAAPIALAWGHSDILMTDVGGQVTIGGANELETVDENFDLTTKVFPGVMIPDFPPFDPQDYGRDEPGFFAFVDGSPDLPAGSSALPPGAAVSVAFPSFSWKGGQDTIFYWNGADPINFEPISSVQPEFAMSIDPNPIGNTGTMDSSGALHEHAAFALDNSGPGVPADGVYLVSPVASVDGLTTSKPFYVVWLVDALISDDEVAEELEGALETDMPTVAGKNFQFFLDAVDYVNDNVAVPEPRSGVLMMFGLPVAFVAVARRRRNELP